MPEPLIEGTDYYLDNGRWVFTAAYLLKRGYCCDNGCRHCPYEKSTDIRAAAMGERFAACEPAEKSLLDVRGPERGKICPHCRNAFSCRRGGCWCTALEVPSGVLAALRARYADCLCPACLQGFAAGTLKLQEAPA